MNIFRRPTLAILVVCKANICRSPMAEGALRLALQQRGLQRKVRVDSAGTNAAQPGRPADPRAGKLCLQAGVDLSKCRARQVRDKDFEKYDYILAMDSQNLQWLLDASPHDHRANISLLGSWGGGAVDIPDPYYGSVSGFEPVFALVQDLIEEFVEQVVLAEASRLL